MNLTVMTFNLRVDTPIDGGNAWPYRKNQAAALIRSVNPVILGTQEGRYAMLRELDDELQDYSRFGEGRAGFESGDSMLDECCAIYYRHDLLQLVDKGQFYLSLTPETPASVSWDSSYPRLCTWGLFQTVHAPGGSFYMFNTHLDHMSQEAREQGAALIADRIALLRSKHPAPAILTGDFNAYPDDPAIAMLQAHLTDAYSALPGQPGATFHEYLGGSEGEPIDYIFVSPDMDVESIVVHRNAENGVYPSDHYPVSCTVKPLNTDNNHITLTQERLVAWVEISKLCARDGKVASYIPELSKAPKEALGIHILDMAGNSISAGDCGLSFTMQSISKVFTLLLALMDRGEEVVFDKVGMEPTGDNFNSMLKLELVQPGIPFNPLINAGAIAISSLIAGDGPLQKSARTLQFFREVAHNERLDYDDAVYRSEAKSADLNRSMAYFLKDKGVLDGDVEDVLDVYFRHCSINITCADLARMALVLAADGRDPITGQRLIPRRYVQIAKTFMVTCGMYNASGQFAIQVGLPAKSGVAGGILTLVPGKYGIGVVGPALNPKGNSIAGVHLLETLSRELDWSLF